MPAEVLSVPIIDVSPLFSTEESNIELRQKTVKEIGDACRDWGFFYVVGHNILPEVVQEFKTQSFDFFRKPKEFKRTILRKPDNLRGYFDQELTKQKLDWKEVFDYGAENTTNDSGLKVDGGNLWPEGMSEFKSTLIHFYQSMYDLSQELVLAMFASLNVDPKELQKETKGSYDTSIFRLNLYPACPDPNKHLGVGPHTDSGSLTVLLQDDKVSSLQVQRDGKFYDIPPVPNSFVINIGDMTQVWSNDLYKAPVHQVLTNKENERFSAAFFLTLSYDAIVEPLKQCISEEQPPIYKPFTWGEFLKGRVAGNYADVGEDLQISHYKIKY